MNDKSRPRAAPATDGKKVSNRVPLAADNQRQKTLRLDIEHFRARVLQDALTEATAAYWRRRADVLEAARPRPDEWHGNATLEDRRASWNRLTLMALNCRRHADLIEQGGDISDEVHIVLAEVA